MSVFPPNSLLPSKWTLSKRKVACMHGSHSGAMSMRCFCDDMFIASEYVHSRLCAEEWTCKSRLFLTANMNTSRRHVALTSTDSTEAYYQGCFRKSGLGQSTAATGGELRPDLPHGSCACWTSQQEADEDSGPTQKSLATTGQTAKEEGAYSALHVVH